MAKEACCNGVAIVIMKVKKASFRLRPIGGLSLLSQMTLFELIICSKACDFLTELLKLLNDVHMTQSLLGGLLLNTEHLSGPRTTDNLSLERS